MLTPRNRHPMRPAPDARALYLGAHGHKRVTCTEQALVVSNERAQVQRFPLARVARVISNTDTVDWSGPALALCMRAGIGITWLDNAGHVLASMYTRQSSTVAPQTALELWLEAADGTQRYANWLRARRMHILTCWGTDHNATLTPQQWEATKRQYVYRGDYAVHLPASLRDLCLAFVTAQLNSHGLLPLYWGPDAQAVELDQDLCDLLWADMNLRTGTLADDIASGATATELFERWNAHNAGALAQHLIHLQRTSLRALYA